MDRAKDLTGTGDTTEDRRESADYDRGQQGESADDDRGQPTSGYGDDESAGYDRGEQGGFGGR